VDTAVDAALEEIGNSELQGKIAIANAKMAYVKFRGIFSGDRWDKLVKLGARVQRPLWASTSTKNPAYPDTLYVDNLIGANTVNTLPPATLEAFLDHGQVALTIETDLDNSRTQLDNLADLGIDLDAITKKLLDNGVDAFAKPFRTLLEQITKKSEKLRNK
jgi:transaldolase